MALTFDANGYLTPYQVIETDLDVFEKSFAFNKHRRDMYGTLLNFMEKLTLMDTGDYFLWVNGSFVTRKKFPKDIDLVTFIDYRLFNPLESALLALGSRYEGNLDCYFSRIFPENHKLHNVYQWAKQDWFQLFSSTRVHPLSGQVSNVRKIRCVFFRRRSRRKNTPLFFLRPPEAASKRTSYFEHVPKPKRLYPTK